MILEFTKMQGLGNDFVVFNAIDQRIRLTAEQCRFIADRRFGIGCDQILLVEPPRDPRTDFHYRIFNRDGSEVEQCGNGARCFARFVRDQGLTREEVIDVGTHSGRIRLYVEEGDNIRVNMGVPILAPGEIPFTAAQQAVCYPLAVAGETLEVGAVSMGNPHAVLLVDSVAQASVARLGPLLERHPQFPQHTNVGFMEVVTRRHIRLRVYERGTGETLACGTGACAAVVSGRQRGLLDETVRVSLPGGDLVISWQDNNNGPVWMSGPAASVYQGRIAL